MNNKVPLHGTFGVKPETILEMLSEDAPDENPSTFVRPKTDAERKAEKQDKKARKTAKASRRKNRK